MINTDKSIGGGCGSIARLHAELGPENVSKNNTFLLAGEKLLENKFVHVNAQQPAGAERRMGCHMNRLRYI